MKDFSEFPGLSEEETLQMLDRVWDSLGIEHDGDIARIPLEKLPAAMAILSKGMAMGTLRRYHEWLQSEGAFEQPSWQTQ